MQGDSPSSMARRTPDVCRQLQAYTEHIRHLRWCVGLSHSLVRRHPSQVLQELWVEALHCNNALEGSLTVDAILLNLTTVSDHEICGVTPQSLHQRVVLCTSKTVLHENRDVALVCRWGMTTGSLSQGDLSRHTVPRYREHHEHALGRRAVSTHWACGSAATSWPSRHCPQRP